MKTLNKNIMRTILFYFISSTVLLATSCNRKAAEETAEHEVLPPNTVEMNEAQIKAAGIVLGTVEQKMLNTQLKASGLVSVNPQNLVSVSAIMGGYIKSFALVQGSPVSKGQVIAVLENPEFIELQLNYLESKSKLEYAEMEYNRQKELFKANVNSAKTFQLATSEYLSLQAKVSALNQKLKLIGIDAEKLKSDKISSNVSIVSPISGYVKTVSVNAGKYVNPTDVIVEIVNTQNLTLELTLFEKDIAKVAIGQKISFAAPDSPGSTQSAVISQVGKAINNDRTIKVYATVSNEARSLLPGMYVNATIEKPNDSAMALPNDAVLSFEDKDYIFIFFETKKEGEKTVTLYKIVEVEKGVSENGYTQVILPKGLDISATKIVVKGAYNLLSAMKNAGDMAC